MDPYDELDAPVLPPSAAVLEMRKNYKMLGISQFVGLFSLHVTSIDFTIEVSHPSPFSLLATLFLASREILATFETGSRRFLHTGTTTDDG